MNPIEKHKWEKRVLIVNASAPTSVGYKRQEQLLTRGKKGMKERDLIIYKLYDDHWLNHNDKPISQKEADAIRRVYEIPESTFMVVLIGKDGGVKLRKDDIVATRELFSLIDSMPMRKAEIKKNKEPNH